MAEQSKDANVARRKRPSKPNRETEPRRPPDKRLAGDGPPEAASKRAVAAAVSNETLSACVEALPLAMLIIDGGGAIVLVNARAEQLFGYAREELIGQSIGILLPGAVRDAHAKQRAEYFSDLQARPMGRGRVLYALRKDGSEFIAEIGLSFIHTDEGVLVIDTIVNSIRHVLQ